ncbi:MAG TPA: VOC family protein [Streptosporangiaceae bacterium]|jgi:catechol 2,3-dioxygenase-like lactoylglutathione lyase family enzyme
MPLGHLGINVPDLAPAKAYYDALMPLLGFEPFVSDANQFSYRPAGGKVGTHLFFYRADGDRDDYSRHRPGLQHLAFIVKTRAEVHAAHDWALHHGDPVVHEPQEFPQYHPGYFAVFWTDPRGFMLEVVCHRDQS